jgi:YesN/AraC family two-component response regulator
LRTKAGGDEAIGVLQHLETQIDIVMSDIDMPGAVDGFGLSNGYAAIAFPSMSS